MAKEKKLKKDTLNLKDDISIEESFEHLDKIIEEMDDENCAIEKSLELYEKGINIINSVNKKVAKIEKDLKIIRKK